MAYNITRNSDYSSLDRERKRKEGDAAVMRRCWHNSKVLEGNVFRCRRCRTIVGLYHLPTKDISV